MGTKVFNPDKMTTQQLEYAAEAKRIAKEIGIPPNLMIAAIFQESDFNPNAKSPSGPIGMGQLGAAAAKDSGVKDRLDPIQNMYGSARYLKARMDSNNGDVRAALVDYHDGPNAAKNKKATQAAYTHADTVLGHVNKINEYFPETPAQADPHADTGGVQVQDRPTFDMGDADAQAAAAGTPGSAAPEWGGMEQAITAAGAGAGAWKAPGERKQQERNADEIRVNRELNKPTVEANKLLDKQYVEALQKRNDIIEATKKAQTQTGVDAYIPSQVRGGSSHTISNNPSIITNAQAQQAIPDVATGHVRAMQMEPTWGGNVDPRTGLALPSSSLFQPEPTAIEKLLPMPDAPVHAELRKAKVYPASPARKPIGAVGGAVATAAGLNALGGDNVDAALGTVSGLSGATAMHAHNPRTAALAAGVGGVATGAQYLYDKAREKGWIKGYSGKYGSLVQEAPEIAKKLVGAAQGPLSKILGRSEIIQPTAQEIAQFAPRPTQQMKFSEAIAPHEGKYLGVNMSDRFGTHGKRMGGTGFPNFQNVNPLHNANDVVWMNDSQGAATKMIASSKYNGQPMIHTNYIGAPDQHASNKTVHNDIVENFYKNLAAGKISEEQIAKINKGIEARARDTGTLKDRPFSQNFDIRDKFAVQEIAGNTFEGRGALSRMLGTGEGVGKSKNIAVPNYEQILQSHADPLTQGAPTSALGTRLYEVYDQPTMFSEAFHPDYRWTVHGKDQGVQFSAVPQSVGVRDFHSEYKSRFPNAEPHGNAWFSYAKKPQLITEDYIRNAQELGFSRGGLV